MNEVRIIAGTLRGRKLNFQAAEGLRPSLDSVRETLFNWLMFRLSQARCLDAFAGTGALGFEAISRGASEAILLERNAQSVRHLQQNAERLNMASHVQVIETSAFDFLEIKAKETSARHFQAFDLIFLDPPFYQGWLEKALVLIAEKEWLSPEGQVYFEAERSLDISRFPGWCIQRHKKVGELQYGLMTQDAAELNAD